MGLPSGNAIVKAVIINTISVVVALAVTAWIKKQMGKKQEP